MAMSAGPTPIMGPNSVAAPTELILPPTLHEHDLTAETATIENDGGIDALGDAKFGKDHPLYEDLAPGDSYDNGIYWADLPFSDRQKWVNNQMNVETKREISHVWQMFKKDPLSPLGAYSHRYVLGGFGLFTEGYALFSIGNLKSLYEAAWPDCWKNETVCSKNWIAAVDYLQIIGIMVGQVGVGIEGDWVGRRFGLVQDALIMTLGLVMLTASWGTDLNGWVICYGWSQFIYGVGVGGEYPMTSTTALESKSVGASSQKDDKLHRGRNVVLAFLMQGWGQLFNQVVLIVLLLIFHNKGGGPYDTLSAQWTFRVSFGIMAGMTLWLAYYRYYRKVYSSHALQRSKRNAHVNQSGYDFEALKLVGSHFTGRLIGTTTGWLFNDFLFYGNKLFASSFIKIISPASANNVMTGWLWNLVNIGVSLIGYYLAAFLIDHKFYGRKRMQIVGFLGDGILFLICAIWYNELLDPSRIRGFQTIYYLSSFFQQFGPNCSTFLLAAEIYPISVRATAHGISAAAGKLGALLPAIIYNYVDSRTRFWIVCWFGFAGWIVTQVFIPDTTGLDLREQDRYWAYVRQGRPGDYHGIAVHPRHLSMWEKLVLKRHLAYNPELDRIAKVKEMREAYRLRMEIREQGKQREEEEDDEDEDDREISSGASSFFGGEREKRTGTAQSVGGNGSATATNSPRFQY